MESDVAALQDELAAARNERDGHARMLENLQREIAVSNEALEKFRGKIDAADAEIKRQAQQLLDQVAASEEASKAAAAAQEHLHAELHASQKTLDESQQSLILLKSELHQERAVAAAAVAESRGLLERVGSLQARLSEAEHQKSLLEQQNQKLLLDKAEEQRRNDVQKCVQDLKRSPPPQRGSPSVGAVHVGFPLHHHDRRHSAHSEVDADLPERRRSVSFAASSSAELVLDQLPLTPSLAALVSSANLPAREPGLMRARSGSREKETVLQQVAPALDVPVYVRVRILVAVVNALTRPGLPQARAPVQKSGQVQGPPAPPPCNLQRQRLLHCHALIRVANQMKMEQIEKITSSKTRKVRHISTRRWSCSAPLKQKHSFGRIHAHFRSSTCSKTT